MTVESARAIPIQGDTTYPEGADAYVAILAARTGRLYHSFTAPPYVDQPYGPLFYATNALLARASSLDVDRTVHFARLLTFVCFLLCGIVVFRISRKLGFSFNESILAGAMLMSQPAFLTWDATVRSDLPSLLGMLLCLLFALDEGVVGYGACILSGFIAGIAFIFKQSAAAAPAAIAVAFVFRRKFKQVVVLATSAAVPVAIAFGILLWRREPFIEQFTLLGKSIWSLAAAARWMVSPRSAVMLPVPLVIGLVGFTTAIKRDEQSKMVAWFALINLCSGLTSIPQIGGDVNYFLPALAGCALLLPFAMRVVAQAMTTRPWVGAIAAMVLLLGAVATAGACYRHGPHALRPHVPYERLQRLSVISDEPYLVLHGRDPELLDPFTSHAFELEGLWNPSDVVTKIRHGEYDLAILNNGHIIRSYRGVSFFGPSIVSALNASYEVRCVGGSTIVLQPRSRQIAITPEVLGSIVGPCVTNGGNRDPDLSLGPSVR